MRRLQILAVLLSLPFAISASGAEVGGKKPGPDLRPRKFTSLPFKLADVVGLDKAKLNDKARALLAKNGFVVLGPSHGSMPICYRSGGRIPPLITVDSQLEVFLSDFEDAFGRLEVKQSERFAKLQARVWDELLARWEQFPQPARPAAVRVAGLIAVGCKLSQPGWAFPEKLPEELTSPEWRQAVEKDLKAVLRCGGRGESVLWKRKVDWSAFKPVGPYTQNEKLQRYYRAGQWWSLQGLRASIREERLCAGLLAWVFRDSAKAAGTSKKGHIERDLNELEQNYDPFFGPPDDVRVYQLCYAAGARWPEDFGSEKGDQAIQKLFKDARRPTFFSEWPTLGTESDETRGQGLRLLPPRLTPDALCYGCTVWSERTLPNGLDALACFGDELARELTLSLEPAATRPTLSERLAKLREEMVKQERQSQRLEFQSCLRRLYLALAAPRADERLPLFMRTREYHMRGLSSALAVWAATREIYSPRVRMGYAVGADVDLPGVVEPNLDAWQRLIELATAAKCAFDQAGVRFPDRTLTEALRFRAIAEKQLRGEKLTELEKKVFPFYDVRLDRALLKSTERDFDRSVDRRVCVAFARSFSPDKIRWAGKTCCKMYVLVEYGGKLFLCQGGVFDYREFDGPFGTALTREEFRTLMDSKNAPPPPSWTGTYRLEPDSAPDEAK